MLLRRFNVHPDLFLRYRSTDEVCRAVLCVAVAVDEYETLMPHLKASFAALSPGELTACISAGPCKAYAGCGLHLFLR